MDLANDLNPAVLQEFQSKDKKPLASLPTRVSSNTGKRYLLWSEIQNAFDDLDYIRYYSGRVPFQIDDHGEM